MKKIIYILIASLILILVLSGCKTTGKAATPPGWPPDGIYRPKDELVLCSAVMKRCPDGSYVGICNPQTCEFCPCPDEEPPDEPIVIGPNRGRMYWWNGVKYQLATVTQDPSASPAVWRLTSAPSPSSS